MMTAERSVIKIKNTLGPESESCLSGLLRKRVVTFTTYMRDWGIEKFRVWLPARSVTGCLSHLPGEWGIKFAEHKQKWVYWDDLFFIIRNSFCHERKKIVTHTLKEHETYKKKNRLCFLWDVSEVFSSLLKITTDFGKWVGLITFRSLCINFHHIL